jgi:hypothetical protein
MVCKLDTVADACALIGAGTASLEALGYDQRRHTFKSVSTYPRVLWLLLLDALK